MKIPEHIAIIMDGNGRWAKQRRIPRYLGHKKGVERVREIVRTSGEIGVKYLTLYTFSSENWQRPQKEINELMKLLAKLAQEEEPELQKNNVRVKIIGQLYRLPEKARNNLLKLVENTKSNTGLTLVLAISYSGRNEIIDGINACLLTRRRLITEAEFHNLLYDPEIPNPDLLIRTGGEKRISNFLLWQIAYTELYFTDTLWPDFKKDKFLEAIEDFSQRKRRFGRIKPFEIE